MKKAITPEMLSSSQRDEAFQTQLAQDEFWLFVRSWVDATPGEEASHEASRVEALIYSWIKEKKS